MIFSEPTGYACPCPFLTTSAILYQLSSAKVPGVIPGEKFMTILSTYPPYDTCHFLVEKLQVIEASSN